MIQNTNGNIVFSGKILVTGGAGLVGNELITQLLAKGERVTAIYNKTPLANFENSLLEQYPCNIMDTSGLDEVMQGMKKVYHCAAIVTFNPARKRDLFAVNVEGTANVVNAAINAGVKKMVYVSSVAALGRIREDEVITESMKWTEDTSNSNYGKSKYLGELEVWRGIGEGLDAVIVNPVIILGSGNWEQGSSKIFKSVYGEFPWYADGTTGFVDVRDVAKAMLALMESDISSQRFILSAENKSYQEVINIIAKAFNKKLPNKKITPLFAEIVWRLEAIKSMFTGNDPLITKETAATALTKASFDNTKLKKFLPDFNYIKLEDTIAYTANQLQQMLNK